VREELFRHVPFERAAHMAIEKGALTLGAIGVGERFDARFESELAFEDELRVSWAACFGCVETHRGAVDADGGRGRQERGADSGQREGAPRKNEAVHIR
jgi:hypothetical protein